MSLLRLSPKHSLKLELWLNQHPCHLVFKGLATEEKGEEDVLEVKRLNLNTSPSLNWLNQGDHFTIHQLMLLRRARKLLSANNELYKQRLLCRLQEVELLHQRCHAHPNVQILYGMFYCDNEGLYFQVLENTTHSNLEILLTLQTGPVWLNRDRNVQVLIGELAEAVAWCHRQSVIHARIRPRHLWISVDSKGDPHLRLSGFWFASFLVSPASSNSEGSSYLPPRDPTAPKKRVDEWAVGITAINLLTRQFPWTNTQSQRFNWFQAQFLEHEQSRPRTFLHRLVPLHPRVSLLLEQLLHPDWRAASGLTEWSRRLAKMRVVEGEALFVEFAITKPRLTKGVRVRTEVGQEEVGSDLTRVTQVLERTSTHREIEQEGWWRNFLNKYFYCK